MSAINSDHPGSTIPEIIDSGLTAETQPNKKGSVLSKGDSRYWLVEGRLFKNHESAEYSCRFTALKRREHFPLGTQNKKKAAAKAAEIYNHIHSNGWDATLIRYKSDTDSQADPSSTTVGQFIDAARNISTARSHSFDAYAKALRKIVAEVMQIKGGRKYDARGGGAEAWRARIDAVELSSISPADILAWKNKRLRDAEVDPLAKRRATLTVNSLIRNAKALFGKKVLPFVEQTLKLPSPPPFDGVSMEKAPSMRYVSKIDPYALLATAKEELSEPDPEAFKVLVLALVCGLRRSEIDNLLWRAFDFAGSALRVEPSEYHQLKSEDSAGAIDLDADTVALFRAYRAKSPKSLFVIESSKRPSNQMKSRGYRCDGVFKKVLVWLRTQGVEGTKPLHTLRKEIGSIIASEHGIFEASRFLRHSDIRITSAIYADKKKVVVPKVFQGLLKDSETPSDQTRQGS